MDSKKIVIGGVTGGVLFFLLGWLVYGVLLANYMNHHVGRAGRALIRLEPDMLFLIAGQLLFGLLLAYIFLKAGINKPGQGLITGAILGFLITAAYDLSMYATSFALSKRGVLADVLASACITAVVGAILGFIYKRQK